MDWLTDMSPNEPASSPKAAPFTRRYDSLDAWRGLACLMIVLLHASFYGRPEAAPSGVEERVGTALLRVVSRMGIGVYIFFVISGYCIAATADATRRKGRPSSEFFRRRFRRIFPPYWAALALTILLTAALTVLGLPTILKDSGPSDTGSIPYATDLTVSQWIGNLTLTEHWRDHVFGSPELKLLGPSWTLCYEEQFYLVCGLILLVSPSRFFAGVVAVTVFTVVGAVLTLWGGVPLRGFFCDGRWLLFAAGVFVYWHLAASQRPARGAIPAVLLLGFGTAVVLRYVVLARSGTGEQKEQMFEFVVGAGFALFLLVLRSRDEALCRLKVIRPFAFCGRMCYSLYLIHWPIAKLVSASCFFLGCRGVWPTLLVTIPLATALSVLCAWWFYIGVERRFLNTFRPQPQPAQDAVGLPRVALVPSRDEPCPVSS